MAKMTVCFTLDDQADRDLVNWLSRLPRGAKSAAIRERLRNDLRGSVRLAEIYESTKRIERLLESGIVLADAGETGETDSYDVPPDVAAALDSLGL